MSISTTKAMCLRIWRSCRWQKIYFDTSKNGLADVASFHECIYSWEPCGDPFGSITNIEQTERLREALIEKLSPQNPPKDRKIENLKDAIEIMNEILSTKDGSSWGDSEEVRQLSSGEKIYIRQHQLLALCQHIQWVYDTFINIQDAYVSLN